MSTRAVHWHEGQFLRPHHLQAAQRFGEDQAARLADAVQPYDWGCRTVDIDPDALANGRFVVRRLRGRLPDGTLVNVPEDATLPALELAGLLDRGPVTVYLAVPVLRLGRPNAFDPAAGPVDGLARFRLDAQEAEDENTGGDREPVVVRSLNLQLLTSAQDRAGYAAVPLARIERSTRADGRPQLQPGYIPPVLACDAWPAFAADILQAIYDRISRKADVLATQVLARGLVGDTAVTGDALAIGQLRALNEASALLGGLAFTAGIHPLPAYLELCRVVGQLSLFGPTRRPPALPRYDHDDLGGCFYALKRAIDALLDLVVEPEYKDRPFIGAGLRMEVALEGAWVETAWQMYIGVQSTLGADELVRVLTQPGVLDMKLGSADRVDAVFRYGRAGLRFLPVRHPPRALPAPAGMTYFQITADGTADEWVAVQKSLTLAVRLNETRVVGNIQGQREITVQLGGQTSTLRFTLYVVPRKSLAADELLT
jgi:type VI secretion system protein ImpJ